jgi:hypothetical protein
MNEEVNMYLKIFFFGKLRSEGDSGWTFLCLVSSGSAPRCECCFKVLWERVLCDKMAQCRRPRHIPFDVVKKQNGQLGPSPIQMQIDRSGHESLSFSKLALSLEFYIWERACMLNNFFSRCKTDSLNGIGNNNFLWC